jgi:hypothetical protein
LGQSESPGGHEGWQTPLLHAAFGPQALAHTPQLSGSVDRLTQEPPHRKYPVEQAATQPPCSQAWPWGQTAAHAPQSCGLVWVSTQLPEHREKGPGQVQSPFTQVSADPQAALQLPQL